MKNNYPIKYALMPIYEAGDWIHGLNELERSYHVGAYIVSKCYVINELKSYTMDGKFNMHYQVVFPYQIEYGNWVRKEPEFDFYNKITNSIDVGKVYDSYYDALEDADKLNEDILYNKLKQERIEEIRIIYEDNLEEYKRLEREINLMTTDLELNFRPKEQTIIVVSKDKTRILNCSLYDYIKLIFNDDFCACTVTEKEYELMKKQISKFGKLKDGYKKDRCLLVSVPDKKMIKIVNSNLVNELGEFYLKESIMSGCMVMGYDDSLLSLGEDFSFDSFKEGIYTIETYQDFVKSYLPYYRENLSMKVPKIDDVNLKNIITHKSLRLSRK